MTKMTLDKMTILEKWLNERLTSILDARSKVIDCGGAANVIYIPDIFGNQTKDNLTISAILLHVGELYGMKIIADFRVTTDHFYITSGELK